MCFDSIIISKYYRFVKEIILTFHYNLEYFIFKVQIVSNLLEKSAKKGGKPNLAYRLILF